MSVSGTKLRLKRLETQEKAFKRVNIELNFDYLELELQDFFVKVNTQKSVEIIENIIGYYHPY